MNPKPSQGFSRGFFLMPAHLSTTILLILILIISVGWFINSIYVQKNLIAERTGETTLRLARVIADKENRQIEEARNLLAVLGQFSEVKTGEPQSCNQALLSMLENFNTPEPVYANFAVVESNGDITCSGLPLEGKINVTDRTYFQRVITTKNFAIGDYQVGRISGRQSIIVAQPFFDTQGQIEYIMIAAIDLGWLNKILERFELPEGSVLTMTDTNDIILTRNPDNENWVGRKAADSEIFKIASQQIEGTAEAAGLDGVKRIYGFTRIAMVPEPARIFVHLGIPKQFITDQLKKNLPINLGVLGLIFILSFVAIIIERRHHRLHHPKEN